MKPPKRGCTACRARKVRCDRAQPFCTPCMRFGAVCGGYYDYVRLSWPQSKPSRRATTSTSHCLSVHGLGQSSFVQSTVWDLELFYHLTEGQKITTHTRRSLIYLLDAPASWLPHKLDCSEKQLIQYFETHAFLSLTTFSEDHVALRDTLFRMAFSSHSSASAAVLHAILALASLRRNGLQCQALQHKGIALQKLSESVGQGAESMEAVQHGAAGMLLCAFEVQQQVDVPENWILYVRGSKHVIENAKSSRSSWEDSDSAVILRWLHYYDVLAGFSARHWTNRHRENNDWVGTEALANTITVSYPQTRSHQLLQLVADVVQNVTGPADPRYHTDDYWRQMETLGRRLTETHVGCDDNASSLLDSEASALNAMELYKLAALIYVERASMQRFTQSAKIRGWLDRAMTILESLRACPWPLPLLIIGCEAQSDEHRFAIMELICRTCKHTYFGNLGCLRTLLRVSWTQDDLAQSNLSYLERLTGIMSISEITPTLV